MITLQQLEVANASPAEMATAKGAFERKLAAMDERFAAFCRQHGLPLDLDAEELLLRLYGEEDRRQGICEGMQTIVDDYEDVLRFYSRTTTGGAA